jgi:heme-degrading monooxygenase HmoA
MAIKAFIKRKIKREHLKAAYQLVTRARYEAMKQKGYISSETLTEIDAPETILVVSMWKSIENWKAWRNSATRAEIESEFEKLSVQPTEYATFALGVQVPE